MVDASLDESTDDEEDFFIQPSQTVKQFTSSHRQVKISKEDDKEVLTEDIFNPDFVAKQIAAKLASRLDQSKDIFDLETQDDCLLDTVQAENKCSVYSESQNIFNTEMVEANLKLNKSKPFDRVFEGETETTNIEPLETLNIDPSNGNNDQHLFEAETEMVSYQNDNTEDRNEKTYNDSKTGVSDGQIQSNLLSREHFDNSTESCKFSNGSKLEDVEMSELVMSSALTENSAGSQQNQTDDQPQVESNDEDDLFDAPTQLNTNITTRNLIKGESREIADEITEIMKRSDLGATTNKSNNSENKSSIEEKLENSINSSHKMCDELTQENCNVNEAHPVKNSMELNGSRAEGIASVFFSDTLTQVNPAVNNKQVSKLSCKKSVKTESMNSKLENKSSDDQNFEEDDLNFAYQETQLNPNVCEIENAKLSCVANVVTNTEELRRFSLEETQVNMNIDSRSKRQNVNPKDRVYNVFEAETQPYVTFKEAEIIDDSDNTDVEDNIVKVDETSNMTKNNSSDVPARSSDEKINFKKQNSLGIDETSTESDSLLASMPLDFDGLEASEIKEFSKKICLFEPDDEVKTNQGPQHAHGDENNKPSGDENSETGSQGKTIAASTLTVANVDDCSTGALSTLTTADMDVCSTVATSTLTTADTDGCSTVATITVADVDGFSTFATSTLTTAGMDGCSTVASSTLTVADMDVCSTVGGMHFSTCEKSTKKLPGTLVEINKLTLHTEGNDKPAISVSSSKKLKQKNASPMKKAANSTVARRKNLLGSLVNLPKSVLNDSIILSAPCSSSTPFKTSENDNIKKHVMDCPSVDVKDCPGLPHSQDLINNAHNSSCVLKQTNMDTLPLALKRTPRVKKVSRKLAESLVCEEANKVKSDTIEVNQAKRFRSKNTKSDKINLVIVKENDIKSTNQNEVQNEALNVNIDDTEEIKVLTNLATDLKSNGIIQNLDGDTGIDSYEKKVNDKAIKSSLRTSKQTQKIVEEQEMNSSLQENIKCKNETEECNSEKTVNNNKSKPPSKLGLNRLSVSIESFENISNEQTQYKSKPFQKSNPHSKTDSENSKDNNNSKVLSETNHVDEIALTFTKVSKSPSCGAKLEIDKEYAEVSPQKQSQQKDNLDRFSSEKSQSPTKRNRITQESEKVQSFKKIKIVSKHISTRSNKELNNIESERREQKIRATKRVGIIKEKMTPEKKEPTKTQSTPHKRTCPSTITTAEIMTAYALQDNTNLKENACEPLKKSRKVSKDSLKTSENSTNSPIKEIKVEKANKFKKTVRNRKKFIDNIEKFPSEELEEKSSTENYENCKMDSSNSRGRKTATSLNIKTNPESITSKQILGNKITKNIEEDNKFTEVDRSLKKSCRAIKAKTKKFKEETIVLLENKPRMKEKCENETELSSCIETSVTIKTIVSKIKNKSIREKNENPTQKDETCVRGSKRTRTKPARFQDLEESGTSDSSSRSSSLSRKQNVSMESIGVELLELKSSLSSRRQGNSSVSCSLESIESISSANVQNKCDTVFVKPVKSSRNSRKKSKLVESSADAKNSETNERMEEKLEELDKSIVIKRSKSRDSLCSLSSEDSKMSMVSFIPILNTYSIYIVRPSSCLLVL